MARFLLLSCIVGCISMFNPVFGAEASAKNRIELSALDISSAVNAEEHEQLSQILKSYSIYQINLSDLYRNISEKGHNPGLSIILSTDLRWDLDLEVVNFLDDNYFLRVAGKNGIKDYKGTSVKAYKGIVNNNPDNEARITLTAGKLLAMVEDGNKRFYIQKLSELTGVRTTGYNKYVVFGSEDIIDAQKTCALESIPEEIFSDSYSEFIAGACDRQVDIAIAATSDFLKLYEVVETESKIIHLLSMVNGLYASFGVNFIIKTIYVSETTLNDPVKPGELDPYNLRYQFTPWAYSNFGVSFDVASLWVNRDITLNSNTGIAGIASLGSLCSSSDATNVMEYFRGDLTSAINQAHELGHNFGCSHVDDNKINVMSPSIGGSNQIWASSSQSKITSSKSKSCLSDCQAPKAAFSLSNAKACVGEEVAFYDNSQVNPSSWTWNFGDGGASNQQNPVHVFNTPGAWDVSLTVKNESGQTSVKTQKVIVGGDIKPVYNVGATRNEGTGQFLGDKLENQQGVFSIYEKFTAETEIVVESFKISTQSSGRRRFSLYEDKGDLIGFPSDIIKEFEVDLPIGDDIEMVVKWFIPTGDYKLLSNGGEGVHKCGIWYMKELSYPYGHSLITFTESSNLDVANKPGYWLGPYDWKVREQSECGISVSLEDKDQVRGISIYPNPGNGIYNINLPKSDNASIINIYDLPGKRIKTMVVAGYIDQTTLDISSAPSGTYIIEIRSDEKTVIDKIIKR